MFDAPLLRRLIDLPGMEALELLALMQPQAKEPENRAFFPQIDECSVRVFGLTFDEAEAAPRPDGWDGIEHQPISVQIAALEAVGWDARDAKRRPLRMFLQVNQQLWLAIRDVAGSLPFHPEDDGASRLESNLAREAARFRRR